RLFDAVAVILGGHPRVTYEGQDAIELEALAAGAADVVDYGGVVVRTPLEPGPLVVDPTSLVARVLDENARGVPTATIAAGFHRTFGRTVAELAARLAERDGVDAVALTGGVFQNVALTDIVAAALTTA